MSRENVEVVQGPRSTAPAGRLTLAALVAVMAAAGCGGSDSAAPASTAAGPSPSQLAGRPGERRATPGLVPARCRGPASNCRAATGRVVYVERIDPDGDGDLHVVLLDTRSLSAPGVTVLDVSRELRPDRDPEPGDLVTGAGPVYKGSYGQRQIQVTTFRTVR